MQKIYFPHKICVYDKEYIFIVSTCSASEARNRASVIWISLSLSLPF